MFRDWGRGNDFKWFCVAPYFYNAMAIRDKVQRGQLMTAEIIDRGLLNIVRGNDTAILDLNIKQLQSGRDSKGVPLSPPYAPSTVSLKKFKNLPYDRVTLFQEGDFYRGFYLEAINWPLVIDSSDRKTGKLVERYGAPIFGLDRESLRELNSVHIKSEFVRFIREFLQL